MRHLLVTSKNITSLYTRQKKLRKNIFLLITLLFFHPQIDAFKVTYGEHELIIQGPKVKGLISMETQHQFILPFQYFESTECTKEF